MNDCIKIKNEDRIRQRISVETHFKSQMNLNSFFKYNRRKQMKLFTP
jgi:hypothetical protein